MAKPDRASARPDLTVCIVVYRTDPAEIAATCAALDVALKEVPGLRARLYLVDNSPPEALTPKLPRNLEFCEVEVIAGHGNIGFGAANNLVLGRTGDFHLVLNPDVEMARDAIAACLSYMRENGDCGLISPRAVSPDGRPQYLAKRFPSLFDLLLRGFAPRSVRQFFDERLARYEMRGETDGAEVFSGTIVSGCFMFFRGDLFERLRGFDQRYFLYFEDFDLSLRASRLARIVHLPSARIVHGGGAAAGKGLWHIWQFLRSATVFYRTHGLKVA